MALNTAYVQIFEACKFRGCHKSWFYFWGSPSSYPALRLMLCQWNFEDENFADSQLTMKTSKTTSLKNLYVYSMLCVCSSVHFSVPVRFKLTLLHRFPVQQQSYILESVTMSEGCSSSVHLLEQNSSTKQCCWKAVILSVSVLTVNTA